jgi:hypothetical protein
MPTKTNMLNGASESTTCKGSVSELAVMLVAVSVMMRDDDVVVCDDGCVDRLDVLIVAVVVATCSGNVRMSSELVVIGRNLDRHRAMART